MVASINNRERDFKIKYCYTRNWDSWDSQAHTEESATVLNFLTCRVRVTARADIGLTFLLTNSI